MSEITGSSITDAPQVSVTDREISESLRGAEALISSSILPEYKPGMSTWDSATTAFEDWSTVSAIWGGAKEFAVRPNFNEIDYEYLINRDAWELADEERKSTLTEMRKMQKIDSVAYEMLSEWDNALNSVAAEYWLRRYHQAKELEATREASGGFGYVLGATVGVLTDALILNVGAGATTAMTARAAGLNAIKYAVPELIIDAAARDLYDPTFTTQDAVLQLTIGAPAAGLVGAGLNKAFNRGSTKVITDQAFVDSADDLAHKSTGAAMVEGGYTDMPLIKSGGSSADMGIISRVLDAPGLNVLRGPKGILKTLRKAVTSANYQELQEVISSFDRLWKSSELTEGVRRGEASKEAMEEGLNRVRAEMRTHLKQVDDSIDDWMDSTYGKSSRILKPVSDFFPGTTPGRNEIKEFSSKLSVAKDNSLKWDPAIQKLEDSIDKLKDRMAKAQSKNTEADTTFFTDRIAAKEKLLEAAELNRKKATEALKELEGEIAVRGRDSGDTEGFVSLVNQVSTRRDDFYFNQGKRLAANGLIPKTSLRPGYRTQAWDPEEIAKNPVEFRTMLWHQMSDNGPDETFIDDFLIDMQKSESVTARTMDDLIDEDPRLARDVQEAFESGLEEAVEERAARAAADLEAEFGANARTAVENYLNRANTRINKERNLVERHQKAWDKLPRSTEGKPKGSAAELERKWRHLSKAQARLGEWTRKRDEAQKMLDGQQSLEDLYKKIGRGINSQDFRFKKEKKALEKAVQQVEKLAARQRAYAILTKRVDEIYENLSGGKMSRAFESDEYLQTSSRFKRRSIELNGVHHKPEWQRFMRRNDDDNLIGYVENVSRQAELEEKMGEFLRDQGILKEGEHNVAEAWVTWARRKVDEAIMRSKPEEQKELLKFKEVVTGTTEHGMLGKALKEFTREDRLDLFKTTWGPLTDQTLGVSSTLMNAMLLGRVALTLPTDLATTFAGGQRTLTGFKAMTSQLLRGNWLGGVDDVEKMDALLAMTIRGEHIVASSDMAARFDADNFQMSGAGSMARKVEATRQGVGYVASWANFMTPWNRFVRSSVGLDAAAEIVSDAANRKNMSDGLKAAYASAGLGDDVARGINHLDAINALVKKMGTIKQSGSTVANTSKWKGVAVVFENGKARVVKASEVPEGVVSVSGEHMQNKYLSAVRTFANQMHLDPALGDRPFWSKSVHGRVIMAMQSFMYAAADRFLQPALERMSIDTAQASARFMGAAFLGIGLGAVGQGARDYIDGRDTPFTRGPQDAEETWEIVRVGFRRSPMSIGMLDRFWEAASIGVGDHINKAVGVKIVDEVPIKWRHKDQNAFAAMGGPLPGAFTRVTKMVSSPEDVTAEQMSKLTPPFNSLWFQTLISTMD